MVKLKKCPPSKTNSPGPYHVTEFFKPEWGVDPENVKLIEYNLLANLGAEFTVGAPEIENAKTYLAGSIADMQLLLVDIGENVPKDEEAFQKVEDERVRADCDYRKVCELI